MANQTASCLLTTVTRFCKYLILQYLGGTGGRGVGAIQTGSNLGRSAVKGTHNTVAKDRTELGPRGRP